MSTCTFQAQLVSIMEILAKAAVAEINRRVDDGCAVIRLEMSRSQRDIDILKRKCQLMENELRRTRGRGRKRVVLYGTPERLCLTPRNVCVRERSPSVWRGEHVVHTVEENLPPSPPSTHVNAHELEDVETAEIKLERAQDELWKNSKASENVPFCQEETMSPSPTLEDAEPDMPADDPVEPNTQPDNSSSELIEPCSEEAEGPSGMVFLIKTENEEDKEEEKPREEPEDYETKEEEREHLEFDLGERDMRLWSSLTEGNGDLEVDEAESAFSSAHLSHHLAIFPTAAERSGNKPTSAGKTQVELYGTAQASRDDQPQHSPWAGDSRPQPLGHTTQSLARARLRAVSDNANLQQRYRALLRPEDTALGALNTHGASSVAGPTFAGCGQGALGGARRLRTHWRAGADGEKRFSCSFCDRGFVRFSQLKEHLRSHTGEKPYSCAQCGRSFTKQCNLIRHAVVHSGEKPYQCSQCGKCFTQRSSLKSHQRTHLGEKERSLYGLQVNRAVRVPRLNPSQTRGFM